MVKRVMLLILGSVVLTLMMTTIAFGSTGTPATPWDIYYDYAWDQQLNGISDASGVVSPKYPYTPEEYQAYLNDSEVHQYGEAIYTDPLDDLVLTLVDRSTFPFTGFQMMIAGIVVCVLVGGGVTLRLLSRPRKSS